MELKIGESQHFVWLKGIVATVIILNLIDGVLTLIWIFTGRASESNPLMASLIDRHPVLFISVKLLLVFLGTALLWRLRHQAAAVVSIFIAFMVYYFILLFHLRSMNLNLIGRWFW